MLKCIILEEKPCSSTSEAGSEVLHQLYTRNMSLFLIKDVYALRVVKSYTLPFVELIKNFPFFLKSHLSD